MGHATIEGFLGRSQSAGGQRNHYTGQLTLEPVPVTAWKRWDEDIWLIEGKSFVPFYVVDGQQRLTTAIVLIKCLLERVPDDGRIAFAHTREYRQKFLIQEWEVSRAYLFGYERDNPSYEYLKTQILGEVSNQFQGTETTYTANLAAAQKFFREKLKDLEHPELERLFKALTQKFLFNVYELEEELEVFVVFETMNNRGKPLSQLELLKNRLIYLSTLIPEPTRETDRKALRRNINDAWKTIFEFLGREKGRALDDDDFLRAHWIMYFKFAKDEAGQFANFLLRKNFTTQRVITAELPIAELQRYVNSIQSSARKWHAIHFPDRADGLSEQVRSHLQRLDRLGRGAFEPLIMAAMQKSVNDSELTSLLAAAERFVFLVSRLSQRRSDAGDSEFYRLAGQLYRGEKTSAEATETVGTLTNFYFSAEKSIANMRDLFQRENGFYSWDGLRYFLFEYEQYVRERAQMATPRLSWEDLNSTKRDQVSIEHIYPASPVAGDWPDFEERPEGERALLRHSLGNLLALSQRRNSSLSNRPFAKKRQDAEGVRGYFNGSYSEVAVAQFQDWTANSILNRGLAMLHFLEERWSAPLGSRIEKVRFLNLEFLEPPDA